MKESELIYSRELLESVLDNTASSIMLLKPVRNDRHTIIDFKYIFTNRQALHSVGRETLHGKRFTDKFPGVKNSSLLNNYIQVIETGVPYRDVVDITPYGTPVWGQVYARKVEDNLLVTYFDITEGKKAEQVLKEKNELLTRSHRILNSINEACYELDRNGAVTYVNCQALEWWKKSEGEVLGKNIWDLFPESVATHCYDAIQLSALEKKEYAQFEYVSGVFHRWILLSAIPTDDGCIVIFHDTEDRKKAEQEIKEKAHILHSVTENVPAMISLTTYPSGEVEFNSGTLLAALGFDKDEVAKMNLEERTKIFHPDYVEKIKNYYARFDSLMDGEENVAENRIQNKKGDWMWFEVKGRVFRRDEKGKVTQVLHITQDISARKKAEQEIIRLKDETAQKAEDKYHSLFENSDEGVAILELIRDERGQINDFIYKEVNEAFSRNVGQNADFLGKKRSEIASKTEPYFIAALQSVIDTGKSFRGESFSVNFNRWITVQYSLIGEKGSSLVAAVFTDITERKQREQQQAFLLRFSDSLRSEKTEDAVANRALGMLIEYLRLDRSYMVSYYLDENRAELDYQIGNDTVSPLPDHFDLSHYPEAFKATLKGTLVINDELERQGLSEDEKCNSGKLGMRAMVAVTIHKGENNSHWSMVAINSHPRQWTPAETQLIEEVAERTWAAIENAKAEQALRKSEEKYRTLFEMMGQGYAELEIIRDSDGRATDIRYLELNPQFERLTGIPVEKALGRTVREMVPNLDPWWIEEYDRIVRSGCPGLVENEVTGSVSCLTRSQFGKRRKKP